MLKTLEAEQKENLKHKLVQLRRFISNKIPQKSKQKLTEDNFKNEKDERNQNRNWSKNKSLESDLNILSEDSEDPYQSLDAQQIARK